MSQCRIENYLVKKKEEEEEEEREVIILFSLLNKPAMVSVKTGHAVTVSSQQASLLFTNIIKFPEKENFLTVAPQVQYLQIT